MWLLVSLTCLPVHNKLNISLTIVIAISPFSHYWLLMFWIWTPMIKILPKSWWESWIE